MGNWSFGDFFKVSRHARLVEREERGRGGGGGGEGRGGERVQGWEEGRRE